MIPTESTKQLIAFKRLNNKKEKINKNNPKTSF